MDTDPPVPTSSARKKVSKSAQNVSKSAKKPKFIPKPPVQRRRKLILPKSDSSETDSETEQELLSKVIERLRSSGPKVAKKSSDNVTSQGAGSSGTHDPPKKEENNKKRWNLRETTRKRVMFSSSNATKDEDIDHMLVDDESGSSSNSENEYKEPWDPYSNYPVSLPLRPLGSGDPEVLNVEEFGKQVEYDETKINSALELGLSGPEDDNKKHIIFFQFPEQLPLDRVPVSSKDKEKAGSSSSNVSNKCGGLKDLPNGRIGKMLVYKSGAIKLKLGDTIFNVSSGTPSGSDQSAAIMNTKSKDCCVLGKVNKRAIVTPDLNSLLENIN